MFKRGNYRIKIRSVSFKGKAWLRGGGEKRNSKQIFWIYTRFPQPPSIKRKKTQTRSAQRGNLKKERVFTTNRRKYQLNFESYFSLV